MAYTRVNWEDLPSTDTPINAANLNQMDEGIYNNSFESGSNANGDYIKFNDGTMICYKTVDFGSLVFSNAWGSLYETNRQSLGNFPVPFVGSVPNIYIMPHGAYFTEKLNAPTFTSWGDCWFVRPENSTRNVAVSCFAIGKWK